VVTLVARIAEWYSIRMGLVDSLTSILRLEQKENAIFYVVQLRRTVKFYIKSRYDAVMYVV
jgi:hypothetical protein